MRLHRFYIYKDLEKGSDLTLSEAGLLHQMKSVFRFHPGSMVIFFNGDGYDYVSEIVSLSKTEGKFFVTQKTENKFSPNVKLTLAVSLIKKDNFEWVLEKGTELGVSSFIPLISERSEKKGLNMERAKKIVVEASEQSGRNNIPEISEPMDLDDFLREEKRPIVVFHTEGKKFHLREMKEEEVALVGPEGGWSPKEIEMFEKKNIQIILMSTPVLRAETASIAVASVILAGQ